ncbi:g12152 [Coccomyxa viridis]|uniref:G12152 protein n=1 Tax=Coccomyxa viridis TaxID=1274662 RepID=A0ABP1GCA1_9CHLO
MSTGSLSDSDVSSDFDGSRDYSSSDDFESPSQTPRSETEEMAKVTPDTTPVHLSQQGTMKPKVPILGLRQNVNSISCGPAEATPRKEGQPVTARSRPAIPGLAFTQKPEPRSIPSLPPMAPTSSRGCRSRDQAEPLTARRRQPDAAVSVSLISEGLSLLSNAPEGGVAAETAITQISRQLGVSQAELRLFQLREVEGACSEAGQYAVAVNNSRFSLASVEKVLTQNTDLKRQAKSGSQELDTARRLIAEQQAALTAAQQSKSAQDCEHETLKGRCQVLERESAVLKEQLRRSLAVQMEGRKSLEAMRADFERLTQQLAAATQGSSQATQEEALDSAVSGISSEGHVTLPAAQPSQRDRIANVLEKLCDEAVLLRLESCLVHRSE